MIAERFGWPTAETSREERLRLRKVRMPPLEKQNNKRNTKKDFQIEPTNQPHVCLNAHMHLQLTPDQYLSAAGDVEVMTTTPASVELPIQFRFKEHIDQESMVKSLCNHELIDSDDGENQCDLEVKVQNIEDFEQSNLFDEHISISELNNNHANAKG